MEETYETPRWKEKLNRLRARGLSSLTSAKSNLSTRVSKVRTGAHYRMRSGVSSVDNQLRANPGKWAGIAAGAGFVLGLSGRLMRHRNRSTSVPSLFVVEMC